MPKRSRMQVLKHGHDFESVTHIVSAFPLTKRPPRGWFLAFGAAFSLMLVLMYSVGVLFLKGVGVWGINIPVAWGFAIINFVWWIGIGHAGTLISAILFLFRQDWRTSINRFAEAMTLFAVACAGLFPLLHLGRPQKFYYIMPYPDTLGLWPQWRSPLVWDVFAVSTYGTISLVFWYVGLIPDVATMRDRASNRLVKTIYGIMAMGWRGSARHWHRYQTAYLLLAGLATPLVVSVHTVVSFDFAVSNLPGWHTTIFPPYFVAGAVYSGFAMVITLVLPVRAIFGFKDFITEKHMNNMAKVMLATGLIVAYGYIMELFMAWYSANPYEQAVFFQTRWQGPYAWSYWSLIACNIIIPQLLWFRWVRLNPYVLWIVAIIINIGMWLERFVIVITSQHRDFLPSSWDSYWPTVYDYTLFLGTLGLFFSLLFLFIRVLPMISIFELRELVAHHTQEEAWHGANTGEVPPGTGAARGETET
ncbi:MAG: NrfD/PsrC family molybdoenzyme membrane anchor subunit [Phycisphaeraceae bacterium]